MTEDAFDELNPYRPPAVRPADDDDFLLEITSRLTASQQRIGWILIVSLSFLLATNSVFVAALCCLNFLPGLDRIQCLLLITGALASCMLTVAVTGKQMRTSILSFCVYSIAFLSFIYTIVSI